MFRKYKKTPSSIDFRIDSSANTGVVRVRGALTEKRVNEVRKALEACQGQVSHFKLNLENVTAVDLSSIRLLYSTCEILGRSNRPLAIEGLCPVVFTSAVEDMGFSYHNWLCFGR
ncbi:MAG: STAS domain-containing protein [Proteobacteria bacterium]|nr:STAS domain-containing protein [Pseudomonadota bacterium]